jgi:hypothetical protein
VAAGRGGRGRGSGGRGGGRGGGGDGFQVPSLDDRAVVHVWAALEAKGDPAGSEDHLGLGSAGGASGSRRSGASRPTAGCARAGRCSTVAVGSAGTSAGTLADTSAGTSAGAAPLCDPDGGALAAGARARRTSAGATTAARACAA